MPIPRKVDLEQLYELRKIGPDGKQKTMRECAEIFQCSVKTISVSEKKLTGGINKVAQMEVAHKIWDEQLDVKKQLFEINTKLRGIVDKALKQGKQEVAIKGLTEIRQQLNFQVEIIKTMTDYKVIAEFQKEMVELITELTCPSCGAKAELRRAVVEMLKAKKALRASVTL